MPTGLPTWSRGQDWAEAGSRAAGRFRRLLEPQSPKHAHSVARPTCRAATSRGDDTRGKSRARSALLGCIRTTPRGDADQHMSHSHNKETDNEQGAGPFGNWPAGAQRGGSVVLPPTLAGSSSSHRPLCDPRSMRSRLRGDCTREPSPDRLSTALQRAALAVAPRTTRARATRRSWNVRLRHSLRPRASGEYAGYARCRGGPGRGRPA
jgi:hypothetical protein